MPRFDFQLEGVLNVRRNAERMRQRELAVAQAQMRQIEDELRQVDQTVKEANAELRQTRLTGVLDMSYLAAHRRFLAAMQRKGMGLVQKMALARRVVEEKQQALAEAAKQRKVIEKLRERQFGRWIAEMDRRENAELDEIATRLSAGKLQAQRMADEGRGEP